MRSNHAASPAFLPTVTDAMPTGETAPAALAAAVIEISLADARVRVVPGLDDAQVTAVLRAARASALCA
jgi:hypothetical protein